MKRYLIGFVAGIVLAISLTALAVELNVVPNRFPIFVNNVKADIEAYNINGFTYLKLADIAKATGNTMGVKFDEVKGEIDITTTDTTVTPSPTVAPTEAPTAEPTATAVPTSTPVQKGTWEGDIIYHDVDGTKYYILSYIRDLYPNIMFTELDVDKLTVNIALKSSEKATSYLLKDIPIKQFDFRVCVSEAYYLSTIKPVLEKVQ